MGVAEFFRRNRLAQRSWRQGLIAALLAMPMVVFIVLVFIWPMGRFLILSVDNSDLSQSLARTTAAIHDWKMSDGIPAEPVFLALMADLADAQRKGKDGVLAQLVNQRLVGSRYLIIKTAKDAAAGQFAGTPVREAVIAKYPGWTNPRLWAVIAANTGRYTDYYLLASLDLERDDDGHVSRISEDRAIFVQILMRTVWISFVVTLICAVISLPLAQAIVSASPTVSRVLFAMVLFPLWTSLLIRTVIWIIVLQRNGPVNAALTTFGIVGSPLDLIYTRFSLYVAMVQVLLPMMVLSIASVMRRVPDTYMRAARSLGASWITAWWRVQLPLVMPGILSGAAIVFVFSLGYYITPTLVGGPTDQMISTNIAFFTNQSLNWGMAAALSVQLLLVLLAGAFLFLTARALLSRRAKA